MRWPQIPADSKPELYRFFRDIFQVLDQQFRVRVPNTEGAQEIVLVSPGRKVYSVRVADDGTLSTTLMNE